MNRRRPGNDHFSLNTASEKCHCLRQSSPNVELKNRPIVQRGVIYDRMSRSVLTKLATVSWKKTVSCGLSSYWSV